MTAKQIGLLAAFGSVAMLLGALGFQYFGDLPPCKMCYWQRYAHVAAACVGVLVWAYQKPVVYYIGAVAALISAGLGGYHAGVEQKFWEGPTTCTSAPIGGLSTDDLLAQIMAAPVVRCDEIAWDMFGISMAGWNMIISMAFVALWLVAARRSNTAT
jgi:disulfide bond formation protein DsbB